MGTSGFRVLLAIVGVKPLWYCAGDMLLLLMLTGAMVAQGAGRYVEVRYTAEQVALPYGVTYTAWLPEKASKLRGVLIHQHGCGVGAARGGQTAAYDLHWQALAAKWDLALLGPAFHVEKEEQGCGWSQPTGGSAKALLLGLKDLAAKAGHAELETVPWVLWGHSGGGNWSAGMLHLYPERIAAIWFRSGATARVTPPTPPLPELPAAAMSVPMMTNAGVKEKEGRFAPAWTGSMGTFQTYRAKGAPIGFAPDPRTSHETGDQRYLSILFFDACLRLRLPKSGTALRAVPAKGAWYGKVLTDEVMPASQWKGAPEEAVWLPDERVAKAWAEYVRTGAVSDTTPPAAPVVVEAAAAEGGGVQITWEAAADFESGLQAFRIERDGQVIGQVPEKPVGKYGRPLFQSMSYHDTPERPLPEMKFVDAAGKPGAKYRVIAVNSAGLASKPSTPAPSSPRSRARP